MKTTFNKFLGVFGLLWLTLSCFGATHVYFDVNQFGAYPTTNRTITIQPTTPFVGNIIFLPVTDSSGITWYSNANAGIYNCTIKAPPGAINFQLAVTSTNLGVIAAATNTSVSGVQTYPAGAAAWSIQAADARYARNLSNLNVGTLTGGSGVDVYNGAGAVIGSGTRIEVTNLFSITNGMISGTEVTNAAAYQAKIATNGLTPVTLVDGVNSQIAQPSPGVYQVNVTGTGTATNVIDVAAGANVSIVSNALLRTISVPGANPSSLTNFESRKVYLSNGLDITNLNNSFRVMTADGVVQFQQVLNETGVRFTKATGDGSGITNITQAGVVGLVNGLTYLTNVAAFSNNNLLFVDLNGSDSNPGTKSAPFKTIQAAKAASSYGTLIVVGAGSNFITTSVIAPPGGGVVGVGPSTHIWSTNNLTLHGPMFVPSDNSYLGNFTLHSDAPFGSYEDVSVGAVPTHATNWVLENFTIWGRPTKYRNIDGIVFSAGLTNQGIIRNGTIAGGYDAFSFRDNELGDPGTYDVLIQNVVCDIKVPNGTANTARGFNIRRLNPSRFQLQNVVFYMTNANVAADSSVINVVDNTTAATTIDLDNVRYVNLGGSNDVVLASAVTLNMSGGNLPDARIYNPLNAPVQYSFRNGQSLTNIQQRALAYAAGSSGNVLTYTSSNTAAWLPSSSYQYNFTNASFYPTNGDVVRLSQTIRGNTLQINNTTNYLGTSGAGLFSTVGDPNSDLFTFNDIDEFTGGIITRWNGHAGARTFEVVTPNFYASGQYLTNIARTGVTGLEAALSYLTNNSGGGGSGIATASGSGTNTTLYFNNAIWGTNNSLVAGGTQNANAILSGENNVISYNGSDNSILSGGYNSIGFNSSSALVAGGFNNTIGNAGNYSTISGGQSNRITTANSFATVAGGLFGYADGTYSVISGGISNTASGTYSVVPGGQKNTASGANSFAAGTVASATHSGSFVWSDASSGTVTPSVGNNTFNVRAAGGAFFSGGLTAAGTITGNGAGVTNIAPTSITTKTGNGAVVLSNTPTIRAPTILGGMISTDEANTFGLINAQDITVSGGAFTGNGLGISNITAGAIASGSIPAARLTGVALSSNAISYATLSGITTNSGGWVGGLNMTNPATGSFVVVTNGGIAAQAAAGYNILTNGVVALGANAAAAKITLDGVNGNMTNSGAISATNGFWAGGLSKSYLISSGNAGSGLVVNRNDNAYGIEHAFNNGGFLRPIYSGGDPSVSLGDSTHIWTRVWAYSATILGGLTSSTTITATNGVFGAYGAMSIGTTNATYTPGATTTNQVTGFDYRKSFGGIGIVTNSFWVTNAGDYRISWGSGVQPGQNGNTQTITVRTNGVDWPYLRLTINGLNTGSWDTGFKETTISLPANTVVSLWIWDGSTSGTTLTANLAFNIGGAN